MKRKGFIKQMFGVTADGRVEQLSELHIPAGTRVIQSFLISTLFEDNGASFKKVVLPNSVKEIEESAFANIRAEQVLFKNGLEKIDGYAFRGVGIRSENLVFPKTLKSIGHYAFAENRIPKFSQDNSLKKVTLPAGCEYYKDSFDPTTEVVGGKLIEE